MFSVTVSTNRHNIIADSTCEETNSRRIHSHITHCLSSISNSYRPVTAYFCIIAYTYSIYGAIINVQTDHNTGSSIETSTRSKCANKQTFLIIHAVFGKNHSVDAGDAVQLAFAIAFVKARSCIFLPLAAQADVAVHIDVSNIYQTAEQIVTVVTAICIVAIANLMTKGYLIFLCRSAICTNSNSVVVSSLRSIPQSSTIITSISIATNCYSIRRIRRCIIADSDNIVGIYYRTADCYIVVCLQRNPTVNSNTFYTTGKSPYTLISIITDSKRAITQHFCTITYGNGIFRNCCY